MKIKINIKEMKHLKEKSFYNNNYYKYGNMGVELLQHCSEEYETNDYYLINGDNKVFLGSSEEYDEEEIEFMTMYT